ncbi:Phosphoesterase PA-phosphatase related protein [Sulfurovum sp. enrichment culture clone C5]|uniref:Phosphoesterase PA-phosphatase related protein n=1 Tax=Sulfurovum sp. enrichment culture clone C5 TaxID=497650 RepID=A0A0S4XP71_9BACT|nr:Phosphoesterase PA-phosphatase related protein [Sulfurovum sp. enrichment culture clone C5]
MQINKSIRNTVTMLAVVIVFFGLSSVDVYIQDQFYNFQTHKWIVDESLQPWKFIFYDGIKRGLLIVGAIFIIVYIYASLKNRLKSYQKGLLIVVLSSILVPSVVGGLKQTTNMPCPHAEIRYNGELPRTAVWECYTPQYAEKKQRACWPAGHASAGFALLSLYFLFHSRRNKILALSGAMVVGWSMGMYKMLVGDHFFSHTVITMMLAWLIILIIVKFINKISRYKQTEEASV